MGYTINRVSLFALIFSIGILVDDAIVVIENIARHWAMHDGRSRSDAAIEAVAEVGNPTIIATLTVVVALLPMLFVSGLMGPYMSPIPANASAAMIFSFFVAVMVTPWLMMRLGRKDGGSHAEEGGGFLARSYVAVAGPILKNRKRSLIFLVSVGIATLASLSLFETKAVTVKLLPFDNKSEMQVVIDLPNGSSLEDTGRVLQAVAERLKSLPELASIQSYAGTAAPFNFNGLVRHYYLRNGPEQGDLQVNLSPKDERTRGSHAIALDIRERLRGLEVPRGTAVKVVEVPPGPPVLSTLLAEVYGPDPETRRATATKLREIFESIPFIVDTDDSFRVPAERLRVAIDQDKLEFFRVEQRDVYDTIQAYLSGVTVGYSHRGEGRHPVEIAVALQKRELSLSQHTLSTPVPANAIPGNRSIVELGDVVSLKKERASFPIFRHNGRPAEMVTAELAGRFEAPIYGMLAVSDAIGKADWGAGQKPEIALHGQPDDEIEAHAPLGWRMGSDLYHLPRHGRRLRHRHSRHLLHRCGPVRIVQAAAGDFDARAAYADRHHDRALALQRPIYGDVHDRLHSACRYHRAQFDLACRFHPAAARRRLAFAAGAAGGRCHPVQTDLADGARCHDWGSRHLDRPDFPGPCDLAPLRACLVDPPHRARHSGNLYRVARRWPHITRVRHI